MGKRTWVKLYCDKWLEGSLRQEKPALRGVWADLLALCGGGQFSHEGEIKVRNGIGFTDPMLARVLNITPQMWTFCKKRLIETGRLGVVGNNILTIINWKTYQSEYERQKPQRTKGADESATESAGIDYRLETIDNRVETIDEEKATSPEIKKIEFEEYIEELRPQFADIKFDSELKKFHLYWSEGNRKLKRPKLALLNWMEKAREIKADKNPPSKNVKKGLATRSFKRCPECHYLVEVAKVTERMEICPQCKKKGKEIKLVMKSSW